MQALINLGNELRKGNYLRAINLAGREIFGDSLSVSPSVRFGDLRFPSDLTDKNVPIMRFYFQEYTRRSIYESPRYQGITSISLPVSQNIVDSTSVSYSQEELGVVLGAAMDAGFRSANEGGGISDSLRDTLRGFLDGSAARGVENLGRALSFSLGGANVLGTASVALGRSMNPFQVFIFKSPDFKQHTFSWNFTPRNNSESDSLREIITAFKYHMLPGTTQGAILFSYPEILQIQYINNNYLYSFRPSVLENITVNYSSGGNSFYKGSKAPVSVDITLRVQEVEIWTKETFMRSEGINVNMGE